jgi:hypothetical protein
MMAKCEAQDKELVPCMTIYDVPSIPFDVLLFFLRLLLSLLPPSLSLPPSLPLLAISVGILWHRTQSYNGGKQHICT